MKKVLSMLVIIAMLFSLAACGAGKPAEPEKKEEVKQVEALIADIGEVSLDSEEAIIKAEEAYEELSENDRKDVETYEELEKARTDYDALVVKAEEEKKAAEEKAKREAAIKEVEDLVAEITATDLENAERILAAKAAYDALPDEDKAKVEKGSELAGMAETVEQLKKEEGERLLAGMKKQEDKVRNLCFYYPSGWKFYSDYWAADVRCFALPYIGCQNGNYWLRVVFNYTEDNWVFFEKITVAADEERFYKYFSYYEVTRDNDGGEVWEYVDFEATESDIEMLRAIAESEETIIRFEGDDYYYDFTVTSADKNALKTALDAYEALK